MDKREMFRVICKSLREKVIGLGKIIEDSHTVLMVKNPSKTLVMLKMREPAAGSEFYLGELLACEAMVRIGDTKGIALTMGDDFEKVLAMSVIDAAYNAGVGETVLLDEKLEEMKAEVEKEESAEFGMVMKSKVSFNVMEGS